MPLYSPGVGVITTILGGGNVITQANLAAAAGQKIVTVDDTTGFLAGARVSYVLVGGAVEYNLIFAVDTGTQVTLTTDIGTGGIADNAYVAMISESEYQAAYSINYGNNILPTLPTAMEWGPNIFNVLAYGADNSGTINSRAAIQAAIDAASNFNVPGSGFGGVVFFPAGLYIADNLVAANSVTLRGAGFSGTTTIKAPASSANPDIIHLPAGPVRAFNIEHMRFIGNGNAGQHCLNLAGIAQAGTPFHGGWWNSYIESIWIIDFSGTSIRLYNDGASNVVVQQFVSLRNIRVDVLNGTAAALALGITGYGGQVNIQQCTFNGPGFLAGSKSVHVAAAGGGSPYTVVFVGCTIQSSEKGVLAVTGSGLAFYACYFEDLYYGIDATVGSKGVVVDGCRFANVYDTGGTGWHLRVDNLSFASFTNNYALGTIEQIAVGTGLTGTSGGSIWARNNTTNNIAVDGVYDNIVKQYTSAATLTLGLNSNIFVQTSATPIDNIVSWLAPGELISMRAGNGAITFTNAGNLILGTHGAFYTVPQNGVAVFSKDDQNNKYVLIAEAPRVGVVRLATITNQDVKATGAKSIYTVPTGRTLVVDHIVIRVELFTVGSKSVQAVVSFGGNSASFNDYLNSVTYTVAAVDTMIRDSAEDTAVPIYPAATVFSANVGTASNATLERWGIDLYGYLV